VEGLLKGWTPAKYRLPFSRAEVGGFEARTCLPEKWLSGGTNSSTQRLATSTIFFKNEDGAQKKMQRQEETCFVNGKKTFNPQSGQRRPRRLVINNINSQGTGRDEQGLSTELKKADA